MILELLNYCLNPESSQRAPGFRLCHHSGTMSGAAEGIAGLALSAISVAALFTTCVECFNIVVSARDFSRDYELLCTELSLQKLRLLLWGESVGLASRQGNRKLYDEMVCYTLLTLQTGTPGPYNSGLDDTVVNPIVIKTLTAIKLLLEETQKYDEIYALKENEAAPTTPSRGLSIFKSTFERFSDNLRKNQKQKSVITVTRWAIFDADHFETKIARLRGFIDGLESVTRTLSVLEDQKARLIEEINSITDIASLELVRDACSTRDLSETASQRLSFLDRGTIQSQSGLTTSTCDGSLFYSAVSQLELLTIGGSIEESDVRHEEDRGPRVWAEQPSMLIPQNQRVMESRGSGKKTKQATLDTETSLRYGQLLAGIREEDKAKIELASPAFKKLMESHQGYQVKRLSRILTETKRLHEWASWLSITPLDTDITQALASMEGPPGTPYESGVFWLHIVYPLEYPFHAPKIRFLTRVYHPNIDSRGQICLDTLTSKWAWAYGLQIYAVLATVLLLLDNPVLDDPLVPEIAQTFIEDYDRYCENARVYTRRYATGDRPDISNLQ